MVTQLGFCASMLCYLPVAVLWLNAEPVFLALGQPPRVSALAGRYLRIATIGLPARIVFELSRKFLSAQRYPFTPIATHRRSVFTLGRIVVMPFVVVVPLVCVVLHPLLLKSTIQSYGFDGVAIASVISLWAMAVLSTVYIWYAAPHEPRTWPAFRLAPLLKLERLLLFVRLGCGGLLSMAEW